METHLLLLPQSKQTDTRDLHNLETDTGNITLGLTTATETGDKDFVVLIDEVQATIVLCRYVISTFIYRDGPDQPWTERKRTSNCRYRTIEGQ